MSISGPGIFENDDAADLLTRLEHEGVEAIEEALSATETTGYLDAVDGAAGLAAAALIASVLGRPPWSPKEAYISERLADSVPAIRNRIDLVPRAAAAVRRVRTEPSEMLELMRPPKPSEMLRPMEPSELLELMKTNEEFYRTWIAELDMLAAALSVHQSL